MIVPPSLVDSKSRLPVRSSHAMTDAAKTSVLRSTGSLRSCSGAMYESLPFTRPSCVV